MTRPAAMRLCGEMYGQWTAEQVRAYLADHGIAISLTTVKRWSDPDYAEVKRATDVQRAAERRKVARVCSRMRTLYGCGVPFDSVALVMSVDLGFEVTARQVRYAVETGRLGKALREAVLS